MDEAPRNLIQRATDVWGRRVLLVHTATRRISDVKHRDEERCRRRHKQRDAKGHVAHADLDSILSATYWEFSRTDVALLDAMLADERVSLLLGIARRM